MSFEEKLQQLLLDKVDRDIATHGMSVVGVMDDPPFSYTVGLREEGLPELIVAGLDPYTGHQILTNAKIAMENGLVPDEHDEFPGVLVDHPVRFVEISPSKHPLNVTKIFYKSDDFLAFQIVWPDENGRFPEDEEYQGNPQNLQEEED